MSGHMKWKRYKEMRAMRTQGELDTLKRLVHEYDGFADVDAWGSEEFETARSKLILEAKRLVDEYDTRHFKHLIVKQAPDRDVYIVWVMSADGPAGIFTRAELEVQGASPANLRRADETGSSQIRSEYGQSGAWGDKGFVVGGRWWLDRANLYAYTHAYLQGAHEAAQTYLRECDDAEQAHGDESFDGLLSSSSLAQSPEEIEAEFEAADPSVLPECD